MIDEDDQVWQEVKTELSNIRVDTKLTLILLNQIIGVLSTSPNIPGHSICQSDADPATIERVGKLVCDMGFNARSIPPEDDYAEEMDNNDFPDDTITDPGAHRGSVIGNTDKSLWVCPRCFIAISNMEYEHLNVDGCCDECETTLKQYSEVIWGRGLQ